jgi:hypothetical protein
VAAGKQVVVTVRHGLACSRVGAGAADDDVGVEIIVAIAGVVPAAVGREGGGEDLLVGVRYICVRGRR